MPFSKGESKRQRFAYGVERRGGTTAHAGKESRRPVGNARNEGMRTRRLTTGGTRGMGDDETEEGEAEKHTGDLGRLNTKGLESEERPSGHGPGRLTFRLGKEAGSGTTAG
jgi:hypothetical protein